MPAPHTFSPGQRWNSLTEPELGLGIVELVEGRQVVIRYPARGVTRRYEVSAAPLARARLNPGQMARDVAGDSFRVETVGERDQLLTYVSVSEGKTLAEADLDPHLDVVTPENRLRSGQVDPHPLFDLRREALQIRHDMLASPARGFLGGRIRLFDHQLSIARDVCERHRVRVLLADEVGLGKTIEALLILHRMLLTGRVERVLILVPPALIHQWLAEAYLRFDLVLRVLGRDSVASGLADPGPDEEALPAQLRNSQLCICPLDEKGREVLQAEAFDMLIVDEAHHLIPGSSSFALVEDLATRIDHLLILSATPDRDGEAAHFRRLALLDPARFHDIDAYHAEAAHYGVLADTAERLQRGAALRPEDARLLRERLELPDLEELLAKSHRDESARRRLLGGLLDLHGIGRVMFRNVRARIPGFPRRIHDPEVLAGGDPAPLREEFLVDNQLAEPRSGSIVSAAKDPRCRWLRAFLKDHPEQRVLALCSSSDRVDAFADAIVGPGREVARFHEDMSAIQRDRQAAWFLADGGPQLLVSSSIGAEGRNFQVARHLVLLDLPATPDRLEQLIGRVDRIGQGEEVHIHTPVLQGTPQACMARWFAALQIFERPWHGSPVIDREFGEQILAAAAAVDEVAVDDLIERGRMRNAEIIRQLEGGRDRLLELTSFDLDAAHQLSDAIANAHEDDELEQFMVFAFERAGLKVEHIDHRSYAVRAGVDYHRPFPGFVAPALGVTGDRRRALRHPERGLLTFDHPMVRDTLDSLLAHETGNASIASLRLPGQQGLLLEALFVAEPTVARDLRADRFFPPSPIRIVVDARGREVGLDAAKARALLESADAALLRNDSVLPRLQPLHERARAIAATKCPAMAAAARERMRRELGPAVARLEHLSLVNSSSTLAEEFAAARAEFAHLDAGLRDFRIRLDALRVILMVPESRG